MLMELHQSTLLCLQIKHRDFPFCLLELNCVELYQSTVLVPECKKWLSKVHRCLLIPTNLKCASPNVQDCTAKDVRRGKIVKNTHKQSPQTKISKLKGYFRQLHRNLSFNTKIILLIHKNGKSS
ncbi:hypothetical protein ACB094_05G039800 [Castanea mollissima]